MRLHNRVAAGKEPVGDFHVENSFECFESFVINQPNKYINNEKESRSGNP